MYMRTTKDITDDEIRLAFSNTCTFEDVCKSLNFTGGTARRKIKERALKLSIDISRKLQHPNKRRICLKCGKEIKPLFPELFDVINFNSNMWDSGIVFKTTGPYGSELDSETIIICVCDGCAKKYCDIIKN